MMSWNLLKCSSYCDGFDTEIEVYANCFAILVQTPEDDSDDWEFFSPGPLFIFDEIKFCPEGFDKKMLIKS